jgi:hypothetical protein
MAFILASHVGPRGSMHLKSVSLSRRRFCPAARLRLQLFSICSRRANLLENIGSAPAAILISLCCCRVYPARSRCVGCWSRASNILSLFAGWPRFLSIAATAALLFSIFCLELDNHGRWHEFIPTRYTHGVGGSACHHLFLFHVSESLSQGWEKGRREGSGPEVGAGVLHDHFQYLYGLYPFSGTWGPKPLEMEVPFGTIWSRLGVIAISPDLVYIIHSFPYQ